VTRLLYLVHSLPPEEETGTPLFVHGYARALAARGFDVTVLYGSPSATSWALEPWRKPGESFDRVRAPSTALRSDAPEAAEAFVRLLHRLRPDLLHVVNNVNLPLVWPELAHHRGIPVVRSVTCAEDLCGLIAPVSARSGPAGYCTAPLTPEDCARCIAASHSAVADHAHLVAQLDHKRSRAAHQFTQVFDRIVFATATFRHYFEQTLPLDPAKVRVVGMGMDPAPFSAVARARRPAPADGRPVVFCLAATLDRAKGYGAVSDVFAADELLARSDYRLLLLGGGEEELATSLVAANPLVTWAGPYRSDELPDLLARVDVGLSASYFETFHRVTREYLLAGLPVVGSRAFGIPDVVRPGVNGLLFDHADPGSLGRAVVRLLDDRALLATLTAGARATVVRSVDDEADELASLYREVLAPEHAPAP
jgi:glycosyltransferase involved in cell wall biosynthesis